MFIVVYVGLANLFSVFFILVSTDFLTSLICFFFQIFLQKFCSAFLKLICIHTKIRCNFRIVKLFLKKVIIFFQKSVNIF